MAGTNPSVSEHTMPARRRAPVWSHIVHTRRKHPYRRQSFFNLLPPTPSTILDLGTGPIWTPTATNVVVVVVLVVVLLVIRRATIS